MQITLNRIPFEIEAVEAALRTALLGEAVIARGASRPVWAWDREEGKGRFVVPATPEKAIALPTALTVFVPKAGTSGAALQKAEGPTLKMAERFLAAVGAKEWGQVLQAVSRVTGVPQGKVPVEAFAPLNPVGSYHIRLDTEFQVVELSNGGRNLAAFLFLPALARFRAVLRDAPAEGTALPSLSRPAFVVPPGTKAATALRRMAVARRLAELQAGLGETRPADLPADDPRRIEAAKLGVEWRVLQPKAPPQAA